MEPRIISLSIPNPFFEGRNSVYVIDADPITLIDTGVATDKAFGALCAGLDEHGLSVGQIQRVVLTHKHIDHIGNAWRIQQANGAEICMHVEEAGSLAKVDPDNHRFSQMVTERLAVWRTPSGALPDTSASRMPSWQLQPATARALQDGDIIPFAEGGLRVIHTPGHTMGSVCLQWGRILFTGDHVLQAMSPNIGAGDMRRQGMLARYLESLRRVQDECGDCVAYPGHGSSFERMADRCAELSRHHEQRLEKILGLLQAGPQTVYEVACQLFGPMDDFHLVLGCAEANSHLELLQQRNAIAEDDGVFHWVS